ncbi:transcription activator [Fusarium heterosporum]|uniref:Transcription activator n=1 Tax=Fusarium heterosporum TaxID=42747 RepID=A0A8H5TSC4_FUSHE|nr:transcription activator [Fusarium heterosporum]
MSGRASRACDACRLRKVKCNGSIPCSQCGHLNLACVFSTPPTKRKPTVRGRLVAQIRQGRDTSNSTSPQNETSPVACVSPGIGSTYTTDFFLSLVPDYERVVFPMNPVLLPSEIVKTIHEMDQSNENTAMVYAFAASTINLSRSSWDVDGLCITQITHLLNLGFKAHKQAEVGFGLQDKLPISVKRIITCIFLEHCFYIFKRFDRGLALLREASAMIQMIDLDRYTDASISDHEIASRQRLYCDISIHERFLTVMTGYPAILPPLSSGIPDRDHELLPHIDEGFNRLIELFHVLDDTFLAHWRAQQDPKLSSPEMTAAWIEHKQAELDQHEIKTAETDGELISNGCEGLTELQHVDLFITRLWMRILVWQLALSQGLLQSAPPQNSHEGFSMHFPAQRLSMQLRHLVCRLENIDSIALHGQGILQKLFEITSTVADVLALPIGPDEGQEAEARVEDFLFIVTFLLTFDRIDQSQRQYLKEKLSTLQREQAGFQSLVTYNPDRWTSE